MFIDSVVWIGAKLKRDQGHDKSVPIINKFLNREINIVYVTDYIVLESDEQVEFVIDDVNNFYNGGRINIFKR